MTRYFIIILSLIVLFCCTSPKSTTGIYHLDPKSWPTQTVALDDIIKEIRVIPLETKPECQIGYVYEVKYAPDMIIIANSNGFSCFDCIGNFKGCPVYIPRQTKGSWFVSVTDGINWFESIIKLKEDQKVILRKEVEGFIEGEKVTMDGNPVLVYYRFKDF